ncbi:hypothetical protein [Nonomuraea jabiensis]|uniref:hypothetical protein n=1 Tax=Nonomuraea jabiensis TaxID=882448 RepID=UPI0036D0AE17
MSDRHFELPAHPNLEYYRKQAKHLHRTYETGDAAAEARVAEVLRRLRAYVPRHTTATSAVTAELRDARLIIARESGFPTWQELLSFTEKSRRDLDERQEKRRRLHREVEALLAGDTDRLAGLTAEQADTLLEMLAGPETIPDVRLEKELGVPARGVALRVLLGPLSNFHDLAANDATTALLINVIIAVGQFQRDLQNALTAEGIAAAEAEGPLPRTATRAGRRPACGGAIGVRRPRHLDRGSRPCAWSEPGSHPNLTDRTTARPVESTLAHSDRGPCRSVQLSYSRVPPTAVRRFLNPEHGTRRQRPARRGARTRPGPAEGAARQGPEGDRGIRAGVCRRTARRTSSPVASAAES